MKTRFACFPAATVAAAALVPIVVGAGPAPAADPAPIDPPPVAEVGRPAPDFVLPDTDGKEHRLSDYTKSGRVVVLEWFNPECPFVKKHHKKNKTMAKTLASFRERNVVWLAINSGGPGKQGHGRGRNAKARREYGIEYPLLLDEDGSVGLRYGAKTTPHMFVVDAEGTLRYAGAIDDNRSAGKLGRTNHVARALASVLAGEPVEIAHTKPYGCTVKYASAKTAP